MLRRDFLIICQLFDFTSSRFDTSDMIKHASGLSNTKGEIMALRETLHFLRGTIYGWQSGGSTRRPDSFKNGHVSFWPRLFMPAFLWSSSVIGAGGKSGPRPIQYRRCVDVLRDGQDGHFDPVSVGLGSVHQRLVNQKEGGAEDSIWVYGLYLTDGKWTFKQIFTQISN